MDHRRLTRRQFLKTAFIFTGAVFVPKTGIARWWPMVIGEGAPSRAGAWTTDATTAWLIHDAVAQGDPDLFEGGGLNVADSTVTDALGTIPGATGTPPHRTIAASKWMTCTDAPKHIVDQGTFSFLASGVLNNLNENTILDWQGGTDGGVTFKCANFGSGNVRLGVTNCDKIGFSNNDEVAYNLSTGVRYWFALACDGTSPTWMGVATSFPNLKSDCVATFDGAAKATWTNLAASTSYLWGNNGAADFDGEIYTIGLSSAYKF